MKSLLATLFTTLGVWSSALADQDEHPHKWDMIGNMGTWGWSGMIFGPIMMIVYIVVVVLVVVFLLRWLGGLGHGDVLQIPPGKTLLDILKERFAKGEIDKQEFEERRRVLSE